MLNGNTGTVSRVDPTVDAVTDTVPRVSANPLRIVAGAGGVWIADGANDAVERIDPDTGRIARTVDVGGLPASLAAGPAGVWVAVDATQARSKRCAYSRARPVRYATTTACARSRRPSLSRTPAT